MGTEQETIGARQEGAGAGLRYLMTVKEAARELVEKLPENATWDDLMYEIYVRQKIAAGTKALDEGRVVPHEEVKSRFASRA